MLTQMDGAEGLEGVYVLAATRWANEHIILSFSFHIVAPVLVSRSPQPAGVAFLADGTDV